MVNLGGGHPGREFHPAPKPPKMWRLTCSWRRVVDLQEASQLLKYIPEAVPTLNSYANMCRHDAQEYCFLLCTIRKKQRLLINTKLTTGAKKQYIYIYNGVGDKPILYAHIT